MAPQGTTDHGKALVSWTLPEFEKYDRSFSWYLIATAVVVGLLTWSILTHNYLFAFIIVVVCAILYRQSTATPSRIHFAITEDGLELGENRFYPYKELASFWMVYEPPQVKKLFVSFRSGIRPDLIIPLERQNPLAVRKALGSVLEEDVEKEGEPTTEALGRMLKL